MHLNSNLLKKVKNLKNQKRVKNTKKHLFSDTSRYQPQPL